MAPRFFTTVLPSKSASEWGIERVDDGRPLAEPCCSLQLCKNAAGSIRPMCEKMQFKSRLTCIQAASIARDHLRDGKVLMNKYYSTALILLATPAFSEGTRELGAHEHGVGELNIAVDGDMIAMEFHAPGADIVGFEYEAETAEDRAAIDDAVAILAKPLNLFVLPTEAECSVVKASAALESEELHEEHDHEEHAHDEHSDDEHDHDEHAHDEHSDDEHDHDEHAHDEHSDDEHDHDDHAEAEASHTEFHAEYTLTCGNTGALSELDFAYFDTFENSRELEVQIVTESGAQAFEVTRENPSLDLRGMF